MTSSSLNIEQMPVAPPRRHRRMRPRQPLRATVAVSIGEGEEVVATLGRDNGDTRAEILNQLKAQRVFTPAGNAALARRMTVLLGSMSLRAAAARSGVDHNAIGHMKNGQPVLLESVMTLAHVLEGPNFNYISWLSTALDPILPHRLTEADEVVEDTTTTVVLLPSEAGRDTNQPQMSKTLHLKGINSMEVEQLLQNYGRLPSAIRSMLASFVMSL